MTSSRWIPPSYHVDEDGRIAGARCANEPNNWGRWGELDERGTTNLIDAGRVRAAAALIQTGEVFSLALPLERGGPVHPARSDIVHLYHYSGSDFVAGSELNERHPRFQGSDDYIFMPLQGSTHWDALAHSASDDTLYNGFWLGTVEGYGGARKGSIHQLKDSLVGRGVLLDIPRARGETRLAAGYAIGAEDLDDCAKRQEVEIEPGDILVIRTGHVAWYYELDDKRPFWEHGAPGLARDTVEWLHAHDVAAVAMDNVAVEVEPFEEPVDVIYPLHVRFLRDLGLVLGELWWLETLGEACANDRRYAFFLSAPPLNITNASGSPVNPIAIK
jgi:kynurenine formamidase